MIKWTREVNPSQPITCGPWKGDRSLWGTPDSLRELERTMIENSDIISFHAYDDSLYKIKEKISELRKYSKPLICTEYLARGYGNRFENVLTLFKEENVGAINWGLVDGKTQTKYPWSSWDSTFTSEPDVWHHDIFREDGTPYNKEEIELIKSLTKN